MPPIRFRFRTIMVVIAALAVLLGILNRYRFGVSARTVESKMVIEVSLLKWMPSGWSCSWSGDKVACYPTGWGFWPARTFSLQQVDILNSLPIIVAISSLASALAVYCRSSRRQRSLPLIAATHPNESLEPDRSGDPEGP
jgi:hypothetical protein